VDVLPAALRWVEISGLLWFVGIVTVRRLAANPPGLGWARPGMHFALGLALAGGLPSVVLELARAHDVGDAMLIRAAAEASALILCTRGGRGAVPAGFLSVVLLSVGSHATRADPAVPAVFIDLLHTLSAGMWAGGIVVLAALRPPGGWGSDGGRALIDRFGRVAAIAFAVTALTGVLRATEELTAISDLWTTAYGSVLAIKMAGVVAMAAISALTWRRGVPLARLEAALAIVVMGASALLAAFPIPPAQT
jgi:putative copper export protein